jgi:hypothetical protein
MMAAKARFLCAVLFLLLAGPNVTLATDLPRVVLAPEAHIGAYVTGLRDLNMQDKSFDADIWFWATTPPDVASPLKTMEFTSAKEVKLNYEASQPADDKLWHQVKVSGKFYQNWDLRRYPFDKQVLIISVEEALSDEESLTYAIDRQNSSVSDSLSVEGWTLTGFQIRGAPVRHHSTFGDPRLEPGASSQYAGLTVEITLARQEVMSFFLLTIPAYVAVMVSFLTFFMRMSNTSLNSPRYSMLAGSLFLLIINLRSASDQIGPTSGVGLIQAIHLLAMVCVLLITAAGIRWQGRLDNGVAAEIVNRDRQRIAALLVGLFVLSNAGMIGVAAAG